MRPVLGQSYGQLIPVQPIGTPRHGRQQLWEWDCVCGGRVFRSARSVMAEDRKRAQMCTLCYFRRLRHVV